MTWVAFRETLKQPVSWELRVLLACSRDGCGRTETVVQEGRVEHSGDFLALPAGWMVVNGMLVCPRHVITVSDSEDGAR